MPHLPNPKPVRPGPEQRLRNLQRRFRAVSARHDCTTKLRWVITASIAAAAMLAAYPAISLPVPSTSPVTITLKHIASGPDCDFARLVGLAPARRGEPGYWMHHDRDRMGLLVNLGAVGDVSPLTIAMSYSD
ncbi:hypothetical protein [Bradyrhizobium sp. USDA 223]|uniref:hypothetical protein n=1 Tax=Bradyrhizobium sp. USDA 223 TaxID=3156306 RepID=UPI0038377899